MSSFDEREKAFEEKFKHDQELRFKVTARRNKMLGLWAAQQMGLAGAAAESYAKQVVEAELGKHAGDAAVIAKLKTDLAAKGIDASDHKVKRELERLAQIAKDQVMKE
ncbi:MAG: DUF1476 domain-containing protein [Proteobacteria bacterium]|nr:DUF1476 domain-containing protein [Pseudomonadota bacterium]MBI3499620.1 DUF1476 domain-containing protein [Pseudomonadota bacterium]